MKPRVRTNADMFAEKGNPWNGKRRETPYVPTEITEYEREADRIRNRHGKPAGPSLAERALRHKTDENPEFDSYFCQMADRRDERRPETGRDVVRSYADGAAKIHLKYMKRKPVRVAEGKPDAPEPCPVVAKKVHSVYSVYVKYEDGVEEEFDRNGETSAKKSFDRYASRSDTVEVELWSYETGEMLNRYERKPDV